MAESKKLIHTARKKVIEKADPFRRIYSLRRRHRYAAALRDLMDVESLRLNAPYRSEANHAWYCVGDLAYEMQQVELATIAFRRALRSRSDDVEALWALGNCYSALGRARMAERYFRRAVVLTNNSDPRLVFNLANSLLDQGKYELACSAFREVVTRATGRLRSAARKNAALTELQVAATKSARK